MNHHSTEILEINYLVYRKDKCKIRGGIITEIVSMSCFKLSGIQRKYLHVWMQCSHVHVHPYTGWCIYIYIYILMIYNDVMNVYCCKKHKSKFDIYVYFI